MSSVITTELPLLLSKEFESNEENVNGSMKAAAELHQAQWNKLFNQMESSLSEEEKQLVRFFGFYTNLQLTVSLGRNLCFWWKRH